MARCRPLSLRLGAPGAAFPSSRDVRIVGEGPRHPSPGYAGLLAAVPLNCHLSCHLQPLSAPCSGFATVTQMPMNTTTHGFHGL